MPRPRSQTINKKRKEVSDKRQSQIPSFYILGRGSGRQSWRSIPLVQNKSDAAAEAGDCRR